MSPPKFNYTFAPDLQEYNTPFPAFRASNAQYAGFICGALIFSRHQTAKTGTTNQEQKQQQPPRVLLLQRALTDSLPGLWEGPGGSCESHDGSLLEAVARETFEETGLCVSRFVALVGKVEWEKNDGRMFVKYTFLVEVNHDDDGEPEAGISSSKCDGDGRQMSRPMANGNEPDIPPSLSKCCGYLVKLDPKEHQAFEWVTEQEVRESEGDGPGKYKSFGQQLKTILDGFKLLREQAAFC